MTLTYSSNHPKNILKQFRRRRNSDGLSEFKKKQSVVQIFNMFSFYIYCIVIAVVIYLIIHNSIILPKQEIVLLLQNMHYYRHNNNIENLIESQSLYGTEETKYLRYSVCNGYTNQRLGIVYGLIMSKYLNRTVIIPTVLTDGVQRQEDNVATADTNGKTKPLGAWYNLDNFTKFLNQSGIHYIQEDDDTYRGEDYVLGSCDGLEADKCLQYLKKEHQYDTHLYFNCPFPSISLSKSDIIKHSHLFLQALKHLQPNEKFSQIIWKAQERIQFLSGSNEYNFLHVRMEVDWIAHCQRWQAIKDGKIRDNCFTDTFSLGQHLLSKGVEIDVPLYIATDWNLVNDRIKEAVLAPLRLAGYETITQTSVFNDMINDLEREELGLKDYYLALGSKKFIGNSVSTFSAVVILERRSQGLWSGYYNGGGIPLSVMVPLYKLPWIFAYNSWSAPIDYLTKAAVKSAVAKGGLKPYCMFTGETNSSIYKWLQKEGVEMITHRPNWIIKMTELNTKSWEYSKAHSHLYANAEGIAGTFQRLDIPILEQLKQYDFVFYTDTDVFFRGQISLDAFPHPLPKALGMGPEMNDEFPYNAGVALWNNHALRKSHSALINFILNTSDALYWKDYGPVDQGALNKFYEEDIRSWKLPTKFNKKPYHLYTEDALVVHFHGPKPHHYLEYLQKGTCGNYVFGKLCEMGIQNGVCFYVVEDWFRYIQNEPIARQLYAKCKAVIEKSMTKQKNIIEQ